MEEAFRRASGSVGYDLGRDKANTRLLKDRAGSALSDGIDYTKGPMFMRMGSAAASITGYRPGAVIDLKECAGEILREFYEEGTAALLSAKAALNADAHRFLTERGLDESRSSSVLANAEEAFAMPDKDEFSRLGMEFCKGGMHPVSLAVMGGAGAAAVVIMFLRSPVLAGIVGLVACGLFYYMARQGHRTRATRMMHALPGRLYDLLHGKLQSNIRRYGEIINAAVQT